MSNNLEPGTANKSFVCSAARFARGINLCIRISLSLKIAIDIFRHYRATLTLISAMHRRVIDEAPYRRRPVSHSPAGHIRPIIGIASSRNLRNCGSRPQRAARRIIHPRMDQVLSQPEPLDRILRRSTSLSIINQTRINVPSNAIVEFLASEGDTTLNITTRPI